MQRDRKKKEERITSTEAMQWEKVYHLEWQRRGQFKWGGRRQNWASEQRHHRCSLCKQGEQNFTQQKPLFKETLSSQKSNE